MEYRTFCLLPGIASQEAGRNGRQEQPVGIQIAETDGRSSLREHKLQKWIAGAAGRNTDYGNGRQERLAGIRITGTDGRERQGGIRITETDGRSGRQEQIFERGRML